MLRTWRAGKAWCRTAAVAVVALLGARAASAQVDTYTLTPSQGTFTPLTGGTTVPAIQVDDASSGVLPIGFSFVFDGTPATQVVASSNGWLSFNNAATSSSALTNDLATGSADIRPLVAPLWDDLHGGSGTASYLTTGTAPNRVFTFEWLNWRWNFSASSPVISFQVKLYEGSNRVEYIYRQESTAVNSGSASIGLSGAGSGSGSFLSLADASATPTTSSSTETTSINTKPATGQVYAFAPAPAAACPAPRNLNVTNLLSTGATVNWTTASGGGTFRIEYGLSGFTPGGAGSTPLTSGAGTTSRAITNLTPSTAYQAYVTQLCSGSAGNSTRTGPVNFTTAPVPATNDECSTATPVTVQFGTSCVTPLVGNNLGATGSTGVPAPGCASYNGGDVWFSVVVPVTGTVTVSTGAVSGSSLTDTGMSIYSGTCSNLTQLGCNDDTNGLFSELTVTGQTPGSTLYVRVWAFSNSSQGQFTVCAVAPSNCASPTAPAATANSSTSATLSWSGTQGTGATYEVQYGAPNFVLGTGTSIIGLTAQSTTLTNLTQSTDYCFYVRQNCGTTNGQSAWIGPTCFRTPVLPAANDEPCAAVTAGINQFGNLTSLSGTTVGATTSTVGGLTNSLPACSPALGPKDVWYRATLPAGVTTMTGTLTGNAAGMVRLYTAANCSTSFTLVGCQASSGPNTSVGRFSFTGLTAGTTYYIAVSGYGTADTPGAFGLALASRTQLGGGQVAVYPNPVGSGGNLRVRLQDVRPGTVQSQLLNSLGQVVRTQRIDVRGGTQEYSIETAQLAHGVYQLRLVLGTEVLVQKVVVD